jgi:hypothetical protein
VVLGNFTTRRIPAFARTTNFFNDILHGGIFADCRNHPVRESHRMNPGVVVKFQARNAPCTFASPSPAAALFSKPKNRLGKIPGDAPSLTKIIHGGIFSFFQYHVVHFPNNVIIHFLASQSRAGLGQFSIHDGIFSCCRFSRVSV